MARRKRISFVARKHVVRPVRVRFYARGGRKVSFTGRKKVVRPVRVTFYAKRKRK